MTMVMRDDEHNAVDGQPAEERAGGVWFSLTPDDAAVLDARLEQRRAGVTGGPMPAGSASRARSVDQLLSLLDLAEFEAEQPAGDLVSRTMAAVTQERQRERFARQVEMVSSGGGVGRGPGLGLRQLLTAAAVLLIGTSVLLPVLSQSQGQSQRIACMSRFGQLGQAFGMYASDNQGQAPRYATRPGLTWWNVGQTAEPGRYEATQRSAAEVKVLSNTAHLFILVNDGLTSLASLACPSNAAAQREIDPAQRDWADARQVSYSYQNQYTPEPLRLSEHPGLVILADKNPLFRVRSQGQASLYHDASTRIGSNSRAHGEGGQNTLWGDGSAHWTVRPERDGDNIWTTRRVGVGHVYRGDETPKGQGDSFLVP